MPSRKKVVTRILVGVGENHRSEPSTDHVSMHSEGAESSGESGRHETRGIMATIEDLQPSWAVIWAELVLMLGDSYTSSSLRSSVVSLSN